MHDTELFKQLLGLKDPWFISNVELDGRLQTVMIYVEYPAQTCFECPQCQTAQCAVYDRRDRIWRHLDTCQFKTYIKASMPRVECSKCGIKTVSPPWAEAHSRFTVLFERLAIDAFCEMSISGGCRMLQISWDEASSIIERAVRRGLARRELTDVTRIGIDEKAVGKGQRYITIVTDLVKSKVLWVGKERRSETLDSFFELLDKQGCSRIECISMDMWRPFQAACRKWIPDADSKTVLDRFHIDKYLGQALDQVRQQENRELLRTHDRRLKGSKWDWLFHPENLPDKRREPFEQLRKSDLKTAKAYALRQNIRHLWSCSSPEEAHEHFDYWYQWAIHSGLVPMQKIAKKLKSHLGRILTYLKFRETNSRAEGINNKIQSVKKKAYGFRNLDRFINMIYFHCAGLKMYPYPL